MLYAVLLSQNLSKGKNLGPLKPSQIIEEKQVALADTQVIQTFYLTVTRGTVRSLNVAL